MTDRRWDQDSLTRLPSTGGRPRDSGPNRNVRVGLRRGRPVRRRLGCRSSFSSFAGYSSVDPCHQRESIRLNIAPGPGKGPGGVPRAVTVPEEPSVNRAFSRSLEREFHLRTVEGGEFARAHARARRGPGSAANWDLGSDSPPASGICILSSADHDGRDGRDSRRRDDRRRQIGADLPGRQKR